MDDVSLEQALTVFAEHASALSERELVGLQKTFDIWIYARCPQVLHAMLMRLLNGGLKEECNGPTPAWLDGEQT